MVAEVVVFANAEGIAGVVGAEEVGGVKEVAEVVAGDVVGFGEEHGSAVWSGGKGMELVV